MNPLLLLLTKSLPKMPTNSTASHIVMIERPAHNARACSHEGVDWVCSCGAGCIAEKSVAMTDPFRESDLVKSWSPPLLTSSALHLAVMRGITLGRPWTTLMPGADSSSTLNARTSARQIAGLLLRCAGLISGSTS